MISVNVKSGTTRVTKNVDITSTPAEVFASAGVSPNNAHVNLNGTILSAIDQQATFSQLGVQDGARVDLNAVVKADGANN